MLILSQHVERLYARELLSDGEGGVGYLLKDRVLNVDGFVDAVRRVAEGGTALDPEVVSQLFTRRRRAESPLERQPSVTPNTFGVHDKPARLRSGHDQGVEAGGKLPEPPPGTRLPDRDG